MTSTLHDRARAAAVPVAASSDRTTLPEPTDIPDDVGRSEPLPDIEYTGPIGTADEVPIHVAFARVMADVQALGKTDSRNDSGGRYMFRGVDTVVNAVGPALRRHGVLALPVRVFDVVYGEARTTKGTLMQECTLKVEWLVVGPLGDTLPPLQSAGQATDTQDKATSKAMSVAQRVMWLTALHVPTNDPAAEQSHDRGEAPVPKATDYRDEVVNPDTPLGRLRAIRGEVIRHSLTEAVVVNEVGDEESLISLVHRIARQRLAAGTPTAELGGAS